MIQKTGGIVTTFGVLFVFVAFTGVAGANVDSVDSSEIDMEGQPVLGEHDSPVTLVSYEDFFCPFCGQLNTEVIPQVEKDYVESGDVKIVYKHLPVVGGEDPALASECVADQDHSAFWEYKETIFEEQDRISGLQEEALQDELTDLADDVGVDLEQFTECYENEEAREQVQADAKEAQELGARGTPTVMIEDNMVRGAQPYATFQQIIEDELDNGYDHDETDESDDEPEQPPTPGDAVETYTIDIERGWSMISVPFGTSLDTIREQCALDTYDGHYVWRVTGDTWANPTTLESNKGYYVYGAGDCTVTLEGESAYFDGLQLSEGWNMISADTELDMVSGDCEFRPYQGELLWQLTNNKWTHPDALKTTEGYFVNAKSACELGVPAPPTPE